MNEEYGHISDAFDLLPEEELLITEEQQELYDTYTEEFLERFDQTVKDVDSGEVKTYPLDDVLKILREDS